MQEMLHRIVKTSVEHLHTYVLKSSQISNKIPAEEIRTMQSTILESATSYYSEM